MSKGKQDTSNMVRKERTTITFFKVTWLANVNCWKMPLHMPLRRAWFSFEHGFAYFIRVAEKALFEITFISWTCQGPICPSEKVTTLRIFRSPEPQYLFIFPIKYGFFQPTMGNWECYDLPPFGWKMQKFCQMSRGNLQRKMTVSMFES